MNVFLLYNISQGFTTSTPYGSAPGGYNVYPQPGTHPLAMNHPYNQYSVGGYDPWGYPLPHPGVQSSSPVPQPTKAAEEAAA